MELVLAVVIEKLHEAWNTGFNQQNLINNLYEFIGNQDSNKYAVAHVSQGYASNIRSRSANVRERIKKGAYDSKVISAMPAHIQKHIIPNLKIENQRTLVDNLLDIIRNDSAIGTTTRERMERLAPDSTKLSEFLAEVIVHALTRVNKLSPQNEIDLPDKDKLADDVREEGTSSQKERIEIAIKNSREMLSRLRKYKINKKYVPALDCEIDTQFTLLIGDGGSGKTSWLFDYWEELLEPLEKTPADSAALPIYVPLNRFDGNTDSFIKNYILKNYLCFLSDCEPGKWKEIAKEYNVVLLLDAINEAKNATKLGVEIEDLCDLGFGIVLASRYDMEGWSSLEGFKRVQLLPLSDAIVDNSLKEHQLDVSERLRPLLKKPMFLALLLGIGAEAKSVQSPGELFWAHHNWLLRAFAIDKHGSTYHEIGEIAFNCVLPELATVVGSLRFDGKDVKSVVDNCLANEGWAYRDVLNLFVDAGILVKEGYNRSSRSYTYIFSHEHYLDFYKAYGIYLEMQDGNIPHMLGSGVITNIVSEFLGDLLHEYRFESEDGPSHIENWLQEHVAGRRDDEARLVCRNLIETMKISRDGCLEGCCFDDLDLSLCDFYRASIPFSSFVNAYVTKDAFVSSGHNDFITTMLATPDGTQLITGSDDGLIKIWDATTGKIVKTLLHGHPLCLSISEDGQTLVSGTLTGHIDIINLSTEECTTLCDSPSGTIFSIAITPNGQYIVSSDSYGTILLWKKDCSTWKLKKRLVEKKQSHMSMAVCAISNTHIAINDSGRIEIWDIRIESRQKTLSHNSICQYMVSDVSNNCLYFSDQSGNITEFNFRRNHFRNIAQNVERIRWMDYSPSNHLLAAGIDGEKKTDYNEQSAIYIWNLLSPKTQFSFKTNAEIGLTHGAFCCNNQVAVSDLRNTIHFFDVTTKVSTNHILGHGNPPWEDQQHELISPDGNIAIRYSHHSQLIIWNMKEGTLNCVDLAGFIRFGETEFVHAKHSSSVETPFSPDSSKLAFSQRTTSASISPVSNTKYSYCNEFIVLNLLTGQLAVPNLKGESVKKSVWTSDNQLICITEQNSIFTLTCFGNDKKDSDLYDITAHVSLGKDFEFREVNILPDGSAAIFRSKTNKISVYDMAQRMLIPIKEFDPDDDVSIKLSPYGECAIISSEDGIDILKKRELNAPAENWCIEKLSISFGDNNIWFWGKTIVISLDSNSAYRTFSIWNRATGELLYTIQTWTTPPIVTKNEQYMLYGKRDADELVICNAQTGEIYNSKSCYGYQENWSISDCGKVLACINRDGIIMIHDFKEDLTCFWDPIDAYDVWDCDFSSAEGLDDYIRNTLSLYGANFS